MDKENEQTNDEQATADQGAGDDQSTMATIYSTPTCHFCHMAKAFFEENGVTYTDHNVAEDVEQRNAMMEKTGQMGVPVIEIKGEYIVGFNEGKIKELLGL